MCFFWYDYILLITAFMVWVYVFQIRKMKGKMQC